MSAVNKNNFWQSISLFVVLWSPTIFLDYEYRYLSFSSEIRLSPYIFFIINILSAGYLLSTLSKKSSFDFLLDRYFVLHFCLFTVGILISFDHLQNIRLLIIWFCLSVAPVIAAIYISKQCRRFQLNIVFVIMLPFLIPVLVACATESFASWIPSIVLNEEHNNTGRWKYLHSSPNGFGFDAGVLSVISVACLTFIQRKHMPFVASTLILSLTALYFSGARAAILLAVVGCFTISYAFVTRRTNIWFGCILSITMILFTFLVGVEGFSEYFRLSENIDKASSGRYLAALEAIELIIASPIFGTGFGSADFNPPVSPSNLFYVVLPVEIGLVGAIGAIGMSTLPIKLFFQSKYNRSGLNRFNDLPVLIRVTLPIYFAMLFYLIGEFSVFRISAGNQLFVFCWAYTAIILYSGIKGNEA